MCNCHLGMDVRGRCEVFYDKNDWIKCPVKLDTLVFSIFNECKYVDMIDSIGVKNAFKNNYFKQTIMSQYHINDMEYKQLEKACYIDWNN